MFQKCCGMVSFPWVSGILQKPEFKNNITFFASDCKNVYLISWVLHHGSLAVEPDVEP